MDEILASIRRILNEDDGGAPATAPAGSARSDVEATVTAAKAEDVLILDESMMVSSPAATVRSAAADQGAEPQPAGIDDDTATT
ncbi:MAG TPA: hypothetical protein VHO91_00320, partial [Rhodopila sp.]|nr:hypothetical protein [Rhodopila sp.]